MKKVFFILFAAILSTQTYAQFEKDKSYLSLNTNSFNLNYNSGTKWHFNLDAHAGHFFFDDVMFLGKIGYDHTNKQNVFRVGVGARYYITQNGLHIGANAEYRYNDASENKHNNWFLGPEIGYTFFLNQYLTIEPALYYNISLNNFEGDSEVGLRIGFGFFFDHKKTLKDANIKK